MCLSVSKIEVEEKRGFWGRKLIVVSHEIHKWGAGELVFCFVAFFFFFNVTLGNQKDQNVIQRFSKITAMIYFDLHSVHFSLVQSLSRVRLFIATAAAKSLQSCPTLRDPIDSLPPSSPIPGILQARTLEWVAISFSNAWKWKVKGKSFSRVWLFATAWTIAYQAPPSMGFSWQEYQSGVPLPSLQPHESQHARPSCPSPTPRVHSNSHPLSRWSHPAISSSVIPFSSCPNPSQHQSLFQWVNSLHEVAKVLEFQL